MKEKFITLLRKCEWLIVPAVLIAAAWFSGDYYGRKRVIQSYESKTDTVTKIVTVYKDYPEPAKTALVGYVQVPTYKFLTDTVKAVEWAEITVHDTTVVYLPREQKYYAEEGGKLRLWVSGYEPRLDRYEVSWPETTITQAYVQKPRRWSLGVTAGYGAALHDKRVVLAPYVGIGVSYSLLQF